MQLLIDDVDIFFFCFELLNCDLKGRISILKSRYTSSFMAASRRSVVNDKSLASERYVSCIAIFQCGFYWSSSLLANKSSFRQIWMAEIHLRDGAINFKWLLSNVNSYMSICCNINDWRYLSTTSTTLLNSSVEFKEEKLPILLSSTCSSLEMGIHSLFFVFFLGTSHDSLFCKHFGKIQIELVTARENPLFSSSIMSSTRHQRPIPRFHFKICQQVDFVFISFVFYHCSCSYILTSNMDSVRECWMWFHLLLFSNSQFQSRPTESWKVFRFCFLLPSSWYT